MLYIQHSLRCKLLYYNKLERMKTNKGILAMIVSLWSFLFDFVSDTAETLFIVFRYISTQTTA